MRKRLDCLGEIALKIDLRPKLGLKPTYRQPPLTNPERRGSICCANRTPTTDGFAVGQGFALLRGALLSLLRLRGLLTQRHARRQIRCAKLPPHYRRR